MSVASKKPPARSKDAAPSRSTPKKPDALTLLGVPISHAERVVDASTGLTKGALAAYYASVAPQMLEHLAGRPVSLVRAPRGIAAPLFFQKHAEGTHIQGVDRLDQALMPEHPPLLAIDSQTGILGAAQMNAIEFHTWNARVDAIDRPDRIVFDLDPGEALPFAAVIEGAQMTLSLLDDVGLKPFVKTSGGKGLHIVVPIARRYTWEAARGLSEAIVLKLAATAPDRFVAKSGPKNRIGRIFVDFLRNNRAATTAVAFSARARAGLGVSMPIEREQLATLESGHQWTIGNAVAYLKKRVRDPWQDYSKSASRLESAAKTLGFKLG